MSPCRQIQARAAYLASLPPVDPTRQLAYEHARSCAECAKALAEGERIIAIIDSHPPPPPTDLALQRASEAILRELSPQRSHRSARVALISALSIAAAWAPAVALAKHRAADRASWAWSGAIALCGSALGIAHLGVSTVAAAIVLSGTFSALIGSSGTFFPAIGIHCVLIELIAASLPLATTAFLVVTRRAASRPWMFSAAAALGALAGHAGLHLTCPVRFASPHLWVFHTGGVVLAAMVGLGVSRLPALKPRLS